MKTPAWTKWLVSAAFLAGSGFSAFGLYLAWNLFHQIGLDLSLGTLGVGGNNLILPITLALSTLLISAGVLVVTLLLTFGYLYLVGWKRAE